jgi:hypothetical protein
MPKDFIIGVPLEDDKGKPFLVARVTDARLLNNETIGATYSGFYEMRFPIVLATDSETGILHFFGDESLTAIARSKMIPPVAWQQIPVEHPPPITCD